MGPSGCGKTTTLRMIAGLELPTSRPHPARRPATSPSTGPRARDIAFVFQLFALYPHMNVRRNVGFPLKCQGMPAREIKRRVEEAARLLRIDHLLDRPVSGLSGGDRQRVALGRALVREPQALLMDEPLGALDAEFRALMCGELRGLHNRLGATTVYVTHDQLEAMAMADKIAVMNRGVVEQFGTPREIYERPASMFVADFIGSPPMGFLPFQGRVARGDRTVTIDGMAIPVPEIREDVAEGELVLGLRPEHVRLDEAGPLKGMVFGTEYLGTTQIVAIDTPRGRSRRGCRPQRRSAPARRCGSSLGGGAAVAVRRRHRPGRSERRRARRAGPMAELALQGVTKRFGDLVAVDGLDLTVGDGEFVVLLGPTGAGKTDDAAPDRRVGAGGGRPDRDRRCRCRRPAPAARDVAFVFQQYSLYPHLTVYDNLAFPLRSPTRRVPEGEIRQRVEAVAELLRIAPKLGNKATRLSGGEMQRVAIGRALVRDPQAFLMDEPLVLARRQAARRPAAGAEAHPARPRRHRPLCHPRPDRGHDHGQPDRGDRPRAAGADRHPREIYGDPVSAHVATRLGQPGINLIPHDLMPCPGLPPRQARLIGARTEHLRVHRGPPNGHARAWVDWIEHLGDQIYLHLLDRRAAAGVAGRGRHGTRAPATRSGWSSPPPWFFDADGNRHPHGMRGSMDVPADLLKATIRAVAEQIAAHAEELTALDQAIGDGDHGINLAPRLSARCWPSSTPPRPSRCPRRCARSAPRW